MKSTRVRNSRSCISAFLSVFLLGCSPKPSLLDPDGLRAYAQSPENGLVIKRTLGSIDYVLQYLPSGIVALNAQQSDKFDMKVFQKDLELAKQSLYFRFVVSNSSDKDGKKQKALPKDMYTQKLGYLVSGMLNDFYIVADKDTVKCSSYNFESVDNISPDIRLLLVFDNKKNLLHRDIQMNFNDNILENGILKFSYDKKNLEGIPSLKI